MRTHTTNGNCRPRFEHLEARNLLAGDVTVEVTDGGRLLVHGDELSNAISIEAGQNRGEYIITGQPTEDGDTSVNNVAAVKVEGVSHGMRIRMGAGDDVVAAKEIAVRGGVGISMGSGDDSVGLRDVSVRSLRIALAEGADTASLDHVRVHGKAAVRGGQGADRVHVVDSAFHRRLAVSGGMGDDHIAVVDSAARALSIAALVGDNTIVVHDTNVKNLVTILTGNGDDDITAVNTAPTPDTEAEAGRRPTFWGGARVVDHGGDNSIGIANLVIGRGGLRMRTGDGVDHARLENLRVRGRTRLSTGAQDDHLAIVDSLFARGVVIGMGSGDDVLRIAESTFRRAAVFSGGHGVDTFFNEANEFLGPMIEDFELPADAPA